MSQQTRPPSASTADGNLFLSRKKRRSLFGRIRGDSDGQSAVLSASSPAKVAPQQTTPAPPLTKALVSADRGGTQDRQRIAQTPPHKHLRDEQRRSDPAQPGKNPAEKRPEKLTPKEQIDGIEAEMYHKLVNEIGAPARLKKKINTTLAEKMRKAGWSYRQIAKHFKVSPCTVRRRLREAKLLK